MYPDKTIFQKYGPQIFTVIAALIVFILMGFVSSLDQQSAVSEAETYCDMVQQHKLNPETGWPDYRGTFNEMCRKS